MKRVDAWAVVRQSDGYMAAVVSVPAKAPDEIALLRAANPGDKFRLAHVVEACPNTSALVKAALDWANVGHSPYRNEAGLMNAVEAYERARERK